MQGALNTRSVIVVKGAYAREDVVEIPIAYLLGAQDDLSRKEPGLWDSSQVKDYLQEILLIGMFLDGRRNVRRENL